MDRLKQGRWLKYSADYVRQRYCCADNVTANAGSGGAVFAADDISSVFYPRTKIALGADGVNDGDVSSSNPLPISVATIPSHAVTNAGTFSVQASAIVPGTGATNLGKLEDGAHASGDVGVMALTVRQDTAAALAGTDADYQPLITDSSGKLHVNAGTVTVASHAVTNAGTFATQVDGNALTALQKIDDPVLVDDAAFTPATSSVSMAGFQADETATDSVDEGDAGAARMTLDRKVIVNPQPHTAGGLLIARDIDLDNGTLTVVKNAAGQLYGLTICNTGTVTVFVKFYDAASGTLGTGTPVLTIGIPGNASDDTTLAQSFAHGIAFTTGICVGAGTVVADNDNTDPGANVVIANIYYK